MSVFNHLNTWAIAAYIKCVNFLTVLYLDVVVSQHPHESVSAIHSAISGYLKMAPFREGGAGKGCQLPPDHSDEEGRQDGDDLD